MEFSETVWANMPWDGWRESLQAAYKQMLRSHSHMGFTRLHLLRQKTQNTHAQMHMNNYEAVMYHQLIICSCGFNRNKPLHYYKNTKWASECGPTHSAPTSMRGFACVWAMQILSPEGEPEAPGTPPHYSPPPMYARFKLMPSELWKNKNKTGLTPPFAQSR